MDDCEASASAAPKRRKGHFCALCDSEMNKDAWRLAEAYAESKKQTGWPIVCETCQDFAKAKHQTEKELQDLKKRDSSAFASVRDELSQFVSVRDAPEQRPFRAETVLCDTRSGSRLEHRHIFLSRSAFKQLHGCFPDEVKLAQVKATNWKGQEETGVLQAEPDAAPRLVLWTEKVYTRRREVLTQDEHFYEGQGKDTWSSEVVSSARTMGQSMGGKYAPKLKGATVYSEGDIQEALQRRKKAMASAGRPSGIASLERGSEGLALEDDSGDDDGDDDSDDGDDDSGADDQRPEGSRGLLAIADDPSAGPKARSVAGDASDLETLSAHTTPRKRRRVKAPDNSHAPRCSEPVASPAVASAPFDDGDLATTARTKPPSYWLTVLTPEAVLSGQNVTKRVSWATACQRRTLKSNIVEATCLGCAGSYILGFTPPPRHTETDEGPRVSGCLGVPGLVPEACRKAPFGLACMLLCVSPITGGKG